MFQENQVPRDLAHADKLALALDRPATLSKLICTCNYVRRDFVRRPITRQIIPAEYDHKIDGLHCRNQADPWQSKRMARLWSVMISQSPILGNEH